jgi:conjugative transfer pilus assembly protein TraH
MNAEFLVQKLQSILTNAPAVAFDLALNTLCEKCSNAIKWMEDLSDKLNSLQLDACKLSQVTVAKAFSAAGADNAQIKGLADRSYATETGISNLYYKTQQNQVSAGNTQQYSEDTMLGGCPADIKNVFTTVGGAGTGTVLSNMGVLMGYDPTYMNLARGLFGDILITKVVSGGNASYFYTYVEPCNPVDPNTVVDLLVNGGAQQRPSDGGACQAYSNSLRSTMSTLLAGIAAKMRAKQALTANEANLVDRAPFPIYTALKFAIATEQEGSTVAILTDSVAKAYAFAIVRDLIDLANRAAQTSQTVFAKRTTAPVANCQTDLFLPANLLLENSLLPRLQQAVYPLREAYLASMEENSKNLEIAARYREFQKRVEEDLGKLFSPAVASRALQR